MKQLFLATLAVSILTLGAATKASAQKIVNPEIVTPQKNITSIEKLVAAGNDNKPGTDLVSPRAIKDFTEKYKDVSSENWHKIKDGFISKFTANDVANVIYYDTRGKWVGSIKRYVENKMPFDIRDIVKREYYDYSIDCVEEVETIDSRGLPTYFIHLEYKNKIKLVRIYDQQMDLKEDFEQG